ncbi:hypothetical protein Hte_007578 [Hypoxylon texense]
MVELVKPISLLVLEVEGSAALVFEVAMEVVDAELAESRELDEGSDAVEVDGVSIGDEVELKVELLDTGWLGSLCDEVDWDSALETAEDAGVSGRVNELDIDSAVELTEEDSIPDDATAVPTLELVTSVVEGPLTGTVEEGKKLKEGIVLLSIKVIDREIEVEDVDAAAAEVSLVGEVAKVDDEVERASDVEKEICDGSLSVDEDEASFADEVDDETATLEVFANLYTFDTPPASRHRNL